MSDQLLIEIVEIETEISKVLSLNGNKETKIVVQHRKAIEVKKGIMFKLNVVYE